VCFWPRQVLNLYYKVNVDYMNKVSDITISSLRMLFFNRVTYLWFAPVVSSDSSRCVSCVMSRSF
jgi:hypothetical protein